MEKCDDPCAELQINSESCDCPPPGDCIKAVIQYADISVPIELKPNAAVGKVQIKCFGKSEVKYEENCNNDTSEIIITQRIRIKIPINYGITAHVGKELIECTPDEDNFE